jgi:hypothetical protein
LGCCCCLVWATLSLLNTNYTRCAPIEGFQPLTRNYNFLSFLRK